MPTVPPTMPVSAVESTCVGTAPLSLSVSMETMPASVRFRMYAGAVPIRLAAISAPSTIGMA